MRILEIRVLALPAGIVLAGLSAVAWAADDYVERHGDWWLECYTYQGAMAEYRCAARTMARDGLMLYVVQREDVPYVVLQTEPGVQFDRSQDVSVRADQGEQFLTLPQQRRVAYISGQDAERLLHALTSADMAEVRYRDLLGTLRQARFPLEGLPASHAALKTAVAASPRTLPPGTEAPLPPQEGDAGRPDGRGWLGDLGWLGRLFDW